MTIWLARFNASKKRLMSFKKKKILLRNTDFKER